MYRGNLTANLRIGGLPWQPVGLLAAVIWGAEGARAARGGKPRGTRGTGSGTGMGAAWGSNPKGTIGTG
jgi:hypothetical protein